VLQSGVEVTARCNTAIDYCLRPLLEPRVDGALHLRRTDHRQWEIAVDTMVRSNSTRSLAVALVPDQVLRRAVRDRNWLRIETVSGRMLPWLPQNHAMEFDLAIDGEPRAIRVLVENQVLLQGGLVRCR
jgi:hypothetical protein